MKIVGIPAEEYQTNPVITFAAKFPKVSEIELPITRCDPVVIKTATGRIAEYLINYKPTLTLDEEDNVTFTRHCCYVDKITWERIKRTVDEFKSRGEL